MKSKNELFKNDPVNFTKLFRYGYNHHTNKMEFLPLFEFEEKIIEHIHKNRFSIINKSRQMHLTSLLAAYVTWKLVSKAKTSILYISNNMDAGKKFKQMVRRNIESLPFEIFNTKDIDLNNAKEISLKNGNSFLVAAPTPHSIKYRLNDLVIFDECAFIPYFDEVYMASSCSLNPKKSEVIIVSTPQFEGDTFHKLYTEANLKKNNFSALDVHWTENPLYRVGFSMENGVPTSDWYKQNCIHMGSQEYIDSELNLKFRKPIQNKTVSIAIRLEKNLTDEIQKDMCLKGITNLSDYIRQAILEKLKKS
jgi:hypothetical protein